MTVEQRSIWNAAVLSAPPGLLKELDSSAMLVWVVARDLWQQASMEVARLGMLVKSSVQGVTIQNPYLAIVNKQAQIMLRAAAELGFTPAGRGRVPLSAPDEDQRNPFAENDLPSTTRPN